MQKPNEFQFLKPHQLTNFLEHEEHIATIKQLSLSAITVQSLNLDIEFASKIKAALPTDPNIGPYLTNLQDPTLPREDDVRLYLEPYSMCDNLILRYGLIYIPDENELKLQVLRSCHDSPVSGHLGQDKTFELVSRNYFSPRMRQYINKYIQSCDTCTRNKTPHHKPHGLLHPLSIPPSAWSTVSMDFIVELPPSNGFNAILVCVDRLTKMAHFCPTTTNVTTEGTAQLYF